MKVFLDANVLVSVVNKEYPLFTHSSRILSLTDNKQFEVFTSPICLAITFYFAEKKHRTKLARQKIGMLGEHLSISAVSESAVKKTIKNTAINNFEDGLKYYAAKESGCQCIITEDIKDFYFSDLDILTCESFFVKYLVK
jgi:predicted nucleic acid-binding protein